jgi:putative MFS transporter
MDRWEVNWTMEHALHNWAARDKLDLYCDPDWEIGLIGSMYFAGWCCTLLWVPRLADIYGRKWLNFGSLAFETVLFVVMYFTHSITVVMVCMFFTGACLSGKSTVLYVYAQEFLPARNKTIFGSVLNAADGSTLLWTSIMFAYFPYWKPLYYFIMIAHVVCLVVLFFMPESFVFYYSRKRYDDARRVLSIIAKFNGKPAFTDKFDTEV